MNILLDIFTYHDLRHCCVTVAQWGGCAQLLLHNKQILRSSCVKKEKKDREYLQREVFCTADTTSWHATQFQRKTKEKRGVINGIRSSQSSSRQACRHPVHRAGRLGSGGGKCCSASAQPCISSP